MPRTDIFHIILPTLKYPLHAPAEKIIFFSKYDLPIKVFDYDCVTLNSVQYSMPHNNAINRLITELGILIGDENMCRYRLKLYTAGENLFYIANRKVGKWCMSNLTKICSQEFEFRVR